VTQAPRRSRGPEQHSNPLGDLLDNVSRLSAVTVLVVLILAIYFLRRVSHRAVSLEAVQRQHPSRGEE